jgi:succinyl-diaminopimelate desuccinylase
MNKLKDTVNSYKEELIQSVQNCLKIKSISGDREGTLQVLQFYLDLAQKMGFSVKNVDDLGGVVAYGEGDKTFGMIVHLDTVPEGNGWQFPPFAGQIQDGKIYGRGAIDDKGPALAALYALKAVQDSGAGKGSQAKVQIIIGLDEENVWHSTPELLKRITEPGFSFVPDSKFPVVIAEKGLVWLEVRLSRNLRQDGIVMQRMQGGGESLNIVPEYCEAVLEIDNEQKQVIREKLDRFRLQTKYDLSIADNTPDFKLIAKGKPAHAFICNEGQNAISQLVLFLSQLELESGTKGFLQTYAKSLGMEYFGESLGLAMADELTGKLTVSPGYLRIDQENIILKTDIRFPATERLESVRPKIEKAFAIFQGQLTFLDSLQSLSFPEDDPNIRKLLKVYQDFTGDTTARPLGMGGTTFAKAFQHAVAFGPTFPGMAKVEHQPDEYVEIDHLLKCTELYALALQALLE